MARVKKVPPVAVSISGGGSHGSWSAGALQYVRQEMPLEWRKMRIIYGTSTGALIAAKLGACVVTNDESHFDELVHIYKNVADGDIITPSYLKDGKDIYDIVKPVIDMVISEDDETLANLVMAMLGGNNSVYSTEPLSDLIDRFITPAVWQRIIKAGVRKREPVEIGFCITSMQTGNSIIVSNRTHQDMGILKRAMLASASIPILMEPVDVFGDGQQWVDGGVRDINPWKFLEKSDLFSSIRTILAVSCQQPVMEAGKANYDSLPDILVRVLGILASGVYQDDISQLELLQRKTGFTKRLVNIMPTKRLEGSGVSFKPKMMRDKVKQGFKDARKALADFQKSES